MTDAGNEPREELRCQECGTRLQEGDGHVATEAGAFCRTCFDNLSAQVEQAVRSQSADVNYSAALLGGVAGGAVGVLLWWGFTVVTKISFGLVAVVIGFAVGKGVMMMSGGKRSRGLQALSAGIAGVAFFYANYLVNRSFFHRALAEDGSGYVLPLVPGPSLFIDVVSVGFGAFDLVFLAIVLWQAWKIPAPFRLAS